MHWLNCCLLTILLLGAASETHAQNVTVLFDISASTNAGTTASSDPRDESLKREGISRRSVMMKFVAQTVREAASSVVIVPWNDTTFPSFRLASKNRRAALRQLRIELSQRSGVTKLGHALEASADKSACSVLIVLTDERPDDTERVRAALSQVLNAAPLGVFIVNNPGREHALKYFQDLPDSPKYTAAPMHEDSVLDFIDAMRGEVNACPVA